MDGCVVRDMERLEAMDVEGRDDDAKEERRIHGHALTPPPPLSTWARVWTCTLKSTPSPLAFLVLRSRLEENDATHPSRPSTREPAGRCVH